jgi:hypothetical protein
MGVEHSAPTPPFCGCRGRPEDQLKWPLPPKGEEEAELAEPAES